MSSALPHLNPLVAAWAAAPENNRAPLTDPLLDLSLAISNRLATERLLISFVTPVSGTYTTNQLEGFGRFMDVLARRKLTLGSLTNKSDQLTRLLLAQTPAVFGFARTLAADSTLPYAPRLIGAALLGRASEFRPEALTILESWLTPQVPADTQQAAARALAATGDGSVSERLLQRWDGLTPETRLVVIDALSSRSTWSLELLQAMKDSRVATGTLDATRRARLLNHGNAQVKKLAQAVLDAPSKSDRTALVDRYRGALTMEGNARQGAAMYARLCLSCHQRDGRGVDVGPNLLSVAGHAPEKLLVNIINPNADIQPGFHAYSCQLSDGEEIYGLIQAETANSILFKVADGTIRTLLRKDIAALRGSAISLMPEGLETGLTPNDLADLIAFLRAPAIPLPEP